MFLPIEHRRWKWASSIMGHSAGTRENDDSHLRKMRPYVIFWCIFHGGLWRSCKNMPIPTDSRFDLLPSFGLQATNNFESMDTCIYCRVDHLFSFLWLCFRWSEGGHFQPRHPHVMCQAFTYTSTRFSSHIFPRVVPAHLPFNPTVLSNKYHCRRFHNRHAMGPPSVPSHRPHPRQVSARR